jgi:hypothetical protein
MTAFAIASLLPTALLLTGLPIALLGLRPKGARVTLHARMR